MLTKEQVISDFKVEILPAIEDLQTCKELWEMNLRMLRDGKRISQHSLDTWTFPKEFEKNFEKK